MQEYKLYLMSGTHITERLDFRAADDISALKNANLLRKARAAEVWQAARLVARIFMNGKATVNTRCRTEGQTRMRKLDPPNVVFQIQWEADQRRWHILRKGIPTGGFAYDKSTAVGMAVKDARLEAGRGLKIAVTSLRDGRTVFEWTG